MTPPDFTPYQKIVWSAEHGEPLTLTQVEVEILAEDPHIAGVCHTDCVEFTLALLTPWLAEPGR